MRIDCFDHSDIMDQVQSVAIQMGCILSVFLCSFLGKTFFFFFLASSVSSIASDMETHFHIVLMFLLPFSDKAGCTD